MTKKRQIKKPKFTQKRISTIVEVLERTGSNRAAYTAAGIAESTYHLWCKENEEFYLSTEKAKTKFLDRNKEIMSSLARNALYNLLRYGTRQVRDNSTYGRDKENNEVLLEKKITTTTGGPPRWAIERVLGCPIEELEAVKKLIEAGWISSSAALEIPTHLERLNEDIQDILKRNTI